jgi:virginiamycin B lyase
MAITADAVWVSNAGIRALQRINPGTDEITATVSMPDEPCSGLAEGFGSIWVPLCGKAPAIAQVDEVSNKIVGIVPVGPVDSEGGIMVSTDSLWIVIDKKGILARINPQSHEVTATVKIPEDASNPLYASGLVWVTCHGDGKIIAIDPLSNSIVASEPTGPQPRFLTSSGNSIWTLNQGDGSITRIDAGSRHAIAHIEAGVPGTGGEIAYGAGSIWTTLFGTPLTRVDAKSDRVLRQWTGLGGDSVRYGFDAIWLTDYKRGKLLRIPIAQAVQ